MLNISFDTEEALMRASVIQMALFEEKERYSREKKEHQTPEWVKERIKTIFSHEHYKE
mgnify:CR=1 FL=1